MHTVPRDDLASCQNGRYARRIPVLTRSRKQRRMAETRQEARGEGLYDPRNEHDSCGIGFVANIKGRKSHDIIAGGLQVLVNLGHRGAVGARPVVPWAINAFGVQRGWRCWSRTEPAVH